MPLYHTMGIRSLLAMALVDGAFVCLRRFDAAAALRLISRERVTNLYLVPTLTWACSRQRSDLTIHGSALIICFGIQV